MYEYEKLEGTADTENVMSYIKSIQETSPKKSQEVIGKMYEEMVTGIQRNPNLTDEEKIGELNILNDLVSPYTAIVGPEARRKTPEDMDKEAQGEVIEPLSSAEASQKYKINEELVARLIEMKPTRGAVTQQSPLRDDPIDLITDEMLYEAGYISPGKDAPFFKIRGRRKFIQDFYNDLGQ